MKKFFWLPAVRVPLVLITWFVLALIAWQIVRIVAVIFLIACGR